MNIILQKKSTAAALFTVLLMLLATPVFSQVTRGRLNKCGSDVSLQDVLANPVSLLVEVTGRFINPVVHYRTWIVTALLTCLFSLLYYSGKKLPLLLSTEENDLL